ncbi:sporulation integral membrane protein YtvI [Clostridioides difficile]|uniref:sporulation integral membrane protein YtvI n=1 Tax=Clostridioides difficile TaxID=1496 RepID=UPI001C1CB49E|nr:sporulation integral membrane protein YtvI [Clostridioides difficile]MDK3207300.1 sporulation integral membrane protein YtvI [Clostridioides difficile]MDL0185805.1 sporulation integral membrane protein YtvI [Clostridioides difficile]MDL0189317.1 sporulation integral membrane protein YtvI [Clostridioides difficile]HBF2208568.1 sporulation integral membrane protein YtvI [Clostridioides difficile]HBG3698084.1 sporulation integral membrane protein YtvI [Clostridioides difficile]
MSILENNFLYKLKNNTIFFCIYTLLFIFIYKAFPYIAPFFLGAIIALMINPISQKLENKFRINKGISTLVLSFLAVAIVSTVTTIIVINSMKELMGFLNNISANPEDISNTIMHFLNKINDFMKSFQEIANFDVEQLVNKFSGEVMQITKNLLTSILGLATSIPYIIIFIITLFIATYFIAKDLDKIENSFYNMFTVDVRKKVKNVKKEAGLSLVGYIRAYTILMAITFFAIWGSFALFGLKYGLIVGFVGALMDLIPFLGIITIYLPVIVYYFLIKNYFIAISMTVIFFVLSLIREILEPKLVSVNVGLNPLATLAAIFIGIQVKGIIGVIFCLGLVCMHDILKKVDIF